MSMCAVDDLTKIGEADLSMPDYSFDLVGAWIDSDGGIYLSTDSGCSCPTPWENHRQISDFTGPLTVDQAIEEAKSLWEAATKRGYDWPSFSGFLSEIRACAEARNEC